MRVTRDVLADCLQYKLFFVLKLTGCFYGTMTSYLSKDQRNFGFSIHDPFKRKLLNSKIFPSLLSCHSVVHLYNYFGWGIKSDIRKLQQTVMTTERIIGALLPFFQDIPG